MTSSESTLLSLLAYVLMQNARPEKAVVLLEALDVLQPRDVRTCRMLATAQVRSGKPDRALRTLDRMAMAGGADASFHLLRAQALAALQRPLEARQSMASFVQMRADAQEQLEAEKA